LEVANLIVFDLETGGFKPEEHGLCEIAAIIIDSTTLEEIDRYEAIIAPYKQPSGNMSSYTQGALDVNGLTLSQIHAGKEAKDVAAEFSKLCKDHAKKLTGGQGKVIPVGHNIQTFDIPYLEFFLSIFKIKLTDLFSKTHIDTMWWGRYRWTESGCIVDHKLSTCCEAAGIPLIDGHRAMIDVESNADLLRYFIRNMRSESDTTQVTSKKRQRAEFKFS